MRAVRWAVWVSAALAGCGARTELFVRDVVPPPPCGTDQDCDDGLFCTGAEACREGRCVPGAPVVCDDDDACTDDTCDESAARCEHAPASRDADGDGHRGPRPGTVAGARDACGDDCDDANAGVHPGATEVCNGVDDDCNGAIDDDAVFSPSGLDVRVSDASTAPAGPGGVAWSGERYLATYWGYTEGTSHVNFAALDRTGQVIATPDQARVTRTPSDAFGASVAWSGAALGIVWQDRRDGDYEIYFNRLGPGGDKLGPDQRVTFARGFSINPSITWTGREYLIAWQDERDNLGTGAYEIYAQRVDGDGRQIEDNRRLTHDPANSESPVIAASPTGMAVAWLDGRGGPSGSPVESRGIWFATFAQDFARTSSDQRITTPGDNVVSPALAWNRDRWVVAWHDAAASSPDHEIWGATRGPTGTPLVSPRRLSDDASFSRYPSLVPLGDRVLLVWADDRAGSGYDVFARMLDADLAPRTPAARVTTTPRDAVYPVATPGPDGDVGILFRAQREGAWRVHFTRLQCAIP